MGTNKTRNSAPTGTNKARTDFSQDLEWDEDIADEKSWDNSDPETWNNVVGQGAFANEGVNKTRQSAPSGTNKSRN